MEIDFGNMVHIMLTYHITVIINSYFIKAHSACPCIFIKYLNYGDIILPIRFTRWFACMYVHVQSQSSSTVSRPNLVNFRVCVIISL